MIMHNDQTEFSPLPGWNIESLHREQRAMPRRAVEALVTAVYQSAEADGEAAEARTGVTPLELVDTSVKGLGALSPVELRPGTRVRLVASQAPVPTRSCEVVRCESEGPGAWRVGMRYKRGA